jgi:hypothetical protein
VLAAWLDIHKYYPASLRRRGIEGEGKLRVRIARSGRLIGVDVAAAFPHPSLEAISQVCGRSLVDTARALARLEHAGWLRDTSGWFEASADWADLA